MLPMAAAQRPAQAVVHADAVDGPRAHDLQFFQRERVEQPEIAP
jgi:hypothetical protein